LQSAAPVNLAATDLQAVPGFETTDYALMDGRIVWTGSKARTDHPRNLAHPWSAAPVAYDAKALRHGAALAWAGMDMHIGLLGWLAGQRLVFPLELARPRLNAVAQALRAQDLAAFEAAALRVLGLGHGLTPSGDDLLGGIFFTLAHAPITSDAAWRSAMPGLHARIRSTAQSATNPISAALLDDLMRGSSYRVLHDVFDAFQAGQPGRITDAVNRLLLLGASSGGDMLAGVFLALQICEPPAEPL
jgi:hypothetical protein